MNTDKKNITAVNNLALIKVDYENGLCSKRKVAELHSISTTSLWRYAKDYGWVYACRRNEVIDEFSQMSAKRLMSQKQDLLEEHALVLLQGLQFILFDLPLSPPQALLCALLLS